MLSFDPLYWQGRSDTSLKLGLYSILSSRSARSPLLSAGLMLTGEFASLKEPMEYFDVALLWFYLLTNLNRSDLKGEQNPENRRNN
jgi:hypothetical protein